MIDVFGLGRTIKIAKRAKERGVADMQSTPLEIRRMGESNMMNDEGTLRRLFAGVGAGCALALILTPIGAHAGTPEICIGQAEGVQGPQPKHPQWWDLSLTTAQRETRWTGATAVYDQGSVSPNLGSARSVWDKPSERLFFEFVVNADPQVDADEDIVIVVVSDPTGTVPDLYIQFQPLGDCSPISNCQGKGTDIPAAQIQYSQAFDTGTGVGWGPLTPNNPSNLWTVEHPWVELRPISGKFKWTLKFALEIPTAIETGEAWPNVRTYANAIMHMDTGTSGIAVELPLLCEPALGTNDCLAVSPGAVTPLPESLPMPARWSHVTTGDISACDGIELQEILTGSSYKSTPGQIPGTSINYDFPSDQIPKFSGANLWAGFHNSSDDPVAADSIDATFRISDWGLHWRQWDNASWNVIGTASLSDIVSGGGYSGAPNEGMLESGLYIPPNNIANDYQSIHVRLTPNQPQSVFFTRDSVYRGMDLVRASVFRRPVDIDMTSRVLPPGHVDNELFLLVHSENMPSVQECIDSGQTLYGCANGGSLELAGKSGGKRKIRKVQGAQLPLPQPLPQMPMELDPTQALATDDQGPAAAPAPLPGQGEPAPAQAEWVDIFEVDEGATIDELPKHLVYAFVDTGMAINLPSSPQVPVYRYFSSYGYRVEHRDTPSQGFEHYVHMPGAVEAPAIPGSYHLSVGPDEIVAVSNTVRIIDGVQAECNVPPPPGASMDPADEDLLTTSLMADGVAGVLQNEVQVDPQFGCDPPPLRAPCFEGACAPHNPISYIEGSKYVGQWTEEAVIGVIGEAQQVEFMRLVEQLPAGLAAPPATDREQALDEDEFDEDELLSLPENMPDGCCAQASIEPQARRRGGARLGAMAMMLLLLRRGRRRRRR